MHTSLEGGLDDVDLLAIGQGSPMEDIIHGVLGNSSMAVRGINDYITICYQ